MQGSVMLKDRTIAIIGTGTIGRAIAAGLLKSGKVRTSQLRASTRRKDAGEAFCRDFGIPCPIANAQAVREADMVLLCVKPRDMGKVLDDLRRAGALEHKPLLLSVAAGLSTTFLEERSGGACPVVRAMPNTPCAIGKGMTVVCRGGRARKLHVDLAREVFTPLGRFLELEEKHMDTVTSLSGSGPAFMYVILEALADGGVMRGLPRPVAIELAAQMTLGAAEMVLATGRHPASLKDDVTTPAGCTIAGILALEDGRIRSVLARGVETAAKVAAELGK